MDCSIPGFPVLHYLPEFAQTHVYWVSDAIQPSHPSHWDNTHLLYFSRGRLSLQEIMWLILRHFTHMLHLQSENARLSNAGARVPISVLQYLCKFPREASVWAGPGLQVSRVPGHRSPAADFPILSHEWQCGVWESTSPLVAFQAHVL